MEIKWAVQMSFTLYHAPTRLELIRSFCVIKLKIIFLNWPISYEHKHRQYHHSVKKKKEKKKQYKKTLTQPFIKEINSLIVQLFGDFLAFPMDSC